jgi:hypothetical protein
MSSTYVVDRVLRNKRALLDQGNLIVEIVFRGEFLSIAEEQVARHASKRVLDPDILLVPIHESIA